MMKATRNDRTLVRLRAVSKAFSVDCHGYRVQHLGGDGAGVGYPVLAGARQAPHAAAEIQAGQHHQHQDAQHLGHDIGIGDDQHAQGADSHDRVAQAHAQARSDHSLHKRGVGGQARQHFTGLRGFEKLGALVQHMRVHGIAQVGRDSLTEPGDHVKARR
jgi:hypothetical protein